MVVSVEPLHQTANGQRRYLENLSLLEQNFLERKASSPIQALKWACSCDGESLFLYLFSPSCFSWGLVGVVAPDYEASNCHNKYSFFRAKDFISISQTSILRLFHLKMNYSIKLIKAFCQRPVSAECSLSHTHVHTPVHVSQVKYTVMHAPKIADVLCATSLIFV